MKVSDTQFNQNQQESPVDDIDDTRMTVLSPGIYGHHQFDTRTTVLSPGMYGHHQLISVEQQKNGLPQRPD